VLNLKSKLWVDVDVEAGNGTSDVKGFRISFDVFNAIKEALLALLYFQYH
jgi:hypothetical protein